MAVAELAAKSRMQYCGPRGWLDQVGKPGELRGRQLRAKFPSFFL
jgi:hypothetical protein